MASDNHKARQRARIIEATLRVIFEEGLSRVSMSKVAATAGVTRQTLYNYFRDVDSIIREAVDEHSAEMQRHLLAAIEAADGLQAKLHAFAEPQIVHVSPEHEAFVLHSGLSPEVRACMDAHTHAVKSALQSAIVSQQDAGDIPKSIKPVVATELLSTMVEGAMRAALKHPDHKPYIIESVVRAMLAAVS